MKIKKVQLENFKYFENLTLNIGDANIVVLVGPNGTGKSCIFDAIYYASHTTKYGNIDNDDEYFRKDKKKEATTIITLDDDTELTFSKQTSHKNIYGRTSYRFTREITRNSISSGAGKSVNNDADGNRKFIDLDQRIENDIELALSELIKSAQSKEKIITNEQMRAGTIDPTNLSLKNIFGEKGLQIVEILDPVSNAENNKCDVIFEKNKGNKFSFKNLSSGEKEIFDIIFNFERRKAVSIKEGVYYIDEPELHINTRLQRSLFKELVRLSAKDNIQLWISTHSLGFMREAQEIQAKNQSNICIFEFGELLQTGTHQLDSRIYTREDWKRTFETAVDDLSNLILPKVIIYCEGKQESESSNEEGFDASIYRKIFRDKSNIDFVSSGGGKQVKTNSLVAVKIFEKINSGHIKVYVLKDGDNSSKNGELLSEEERKAQLAKDPNLRMLSRRELENYLCDISVLKKYCSDQGIIFSDSNLNNIDFIKDDVKQKKQDICRSIKRKPDEWENLLMEFSEIIYKNKLDDKISKLYNTLLDDLNLTVI